ncbi:hypothetical protein FRX31_015232, partial [Thalictrum thalictroides]
VGSLQEATQPYYNAPSDFDDDDEESEFPNQETSLRSYTSLRLLIFELDQESFCSLKLNLGFQPFSSRDRYGARRTGMSEDEIPGRYTTRGEFSLFGHHL